MMGRRSLALLLCVVFCWSPRVLLAQSQSLKPGVNEKYEHPDPEAWTKRFEDQKRDAVKKHDDILAACRLKPGMVVADVGAGTGLFTRSMAAEVGPEGKVYAVDIAKEFVDYVKKTCRQQGLDNVVGIVSTSTSAKLPPNSADLIFLCDTYHHFEYPFKMLDSICGALRPDWRLVIVDRRKADDHVRADQATVKKEVTSAGFKFLDAKELSEKEYLMRFQIESPETPRDAQ